MNLIDFYQYLLCQIYVVIKILLLFFILMYLIVLIVFYLIYSYFINFQVLSDKQLYHFYQVAEHLVDDFIRKYYFQ
jgi:hypothetical protein